MRATSTRRDTLSFLGVAGLSVLPACGATKSTEAGPFTSGAGTPLGSSGEAGNASSEAGGAGGKGAAATAEGGGTTGEGGSGDAGQALCEAKQETTVGPFPNKRPLERSDVRGNTSGITTPKPGADLTLKVLVYDLDAFCAPIPDAVIDIWQCDAVGDYAGYQAFNSVGQDFCRGYQTTDAGGLAEFLTIFPGSYSGRAIHIHFSIQGVASDLAPNGRGGNLASVFVAQLYFSRAIAEEIFAAFPTYQQGAAITPNESDGLFAASGSELIVDVTRSGNGYVGQVEIGVSRSSIGL